MSTAVPAYLTVVCPGCGRRSKAHLTKGGRLTRCKACRELFRIPSPDERPAEDRQAEPQRRASSKRAESTVGFGCRVCDTRMTVPQRYVGRKVKCPDCGAATVVPPPEAPRKPDIPAAIFGEQYEVFEGEDQPWAAELTTEQPRLLPVHCRVCRTLMHADPAQVGERIECPDCGATTKVDEPIVAKPMIDVTVTGYGVSAPESLGVSSEVVSAYMEQGRAEAAAEAERNKRPELPRFPLITGVFAFLKSEGIVARTLTLASFLCVGAFLAVLALAVLGVAPAPVGGGFIASVGAVMMAVSVGVMAAAIGLLWFGSFAAHAITIVVESSEGNDRIYDWPSGNPADWFGEAAHLLVAVSAAGAPGWIIAQLAGADLAIAAAAAGLSVVVCFPVMVLSQLETGSPFALFSPKLFGVMIRLPMTGLLFLVQSLVLAAVPVAAVLAVANFGVFGAVAMSAPLVIAALIYFRLLGRLAWVIAEQTD